jgi:hypothetical protein
MGSEAQRNENVAVYQIDTNAVKEMNIRVGTTPTVIAEASPDSQYFAAEHGRPPSESLMLKPAGGGAPWHGEAFEFLQNSVFNARTFFQVGPVKPSHRNYYGGRFTGSIPKLGFLTVSGAQRAVQGMVNGNVLVPLPTERTPLTTDPEKRAIVQRFLDAYPNEYPNRLDFDPRALNTNSPQTINEVNASGRLDTTLTKKDRLYSSYTINRQRIDAFQFVAGQNPDTELHTQRANLTWQRVVSANTQFSLAMSFDRNRSVLLPEPNAVGPRLRYGYQIEELGPDSAFPVNRAANTFRYGGSLSHIIGKHTVTLGADLLRFQLNGVESAQARGQYQFGNNFGRSAVDNLRWGTANAYEVTVGELSRGYRNWSAGFYVADRWRIHPRFQLSYGLRYSLDTAPYEVKNRDVIPYSCDCNNLSPRFSIAWQMGRGWTMRAMYTATFGQILPVTYQQVRNNPPQVYYIQVPEPDIVNPLKGIDITNPNLRYSPTRLAPDMVGPYAHLYNASFERKLNAMSTLRLAYIGSRSFKLLNSYIQNRALPVAGLPLTTANVDLRRPDSRYYDIRYLVNGGIGYFDAAQAGWDFSFRRGIAGGVSYTFSKAIDEGPDFASTAANKDILSFRSQYQYDSLKDRKGLSSFDSPHSLLIYYAWEIPSPLGRWRYLAGGWQISGVNMWKAGTPLTLFVGSDAPGFGNVDGGGSDRPNILDPSILGRTIGDPDTATQIISRDRFAYVFAGQNAGNLGRNNFRKSAIWNWNAAITKQFRFVSDKWLVQLRGEAYNVTNTPQFDEPQRNLTSPAFGKITNTLNDGRVFQLGLRLTF